MGKGCAHQIKNEYIPDVQSELDEYYQCLSDMQINLNCTEEGDQPSEAFALHA